VGQEAAAVVNFAAKLLRGPDYGILPFLSYEEDSTAWIDVLLLLQDDKPTSVEDLEPRNAIIFPSLTWIIAAPVFYQVTLVTHDCVERVVQTGTLPNIETHVLR